MKTIVEPPITSSIKDSFSKAAENYHQQAEVQLKVAEGIISSLRPWKNTLPEGPILEVGCGTGFLTEQLIGEFPQKEMLITDAADGMLSFCRERLTENDLLTERIQFSTLDVDTATIEENQYSLIVSNFAPQWFKDTALGLEKLSQMLKPGGLLLCAFPGNHSFEQWYKYCLALGLPYTANALPDVEEVVIKLSMGPVQVDYYENDIFQNFDHSLDFFRHLKAIGASTNTSGKKLSAKQLKLLTNYWDEQQSEGIKVKWHVVYIAAKKDG
jgi:malonyl-CoA O-methyltransferase